MIDVQKFADIVGIARDYTDASNRYTLISPKARLETLKALGFPADNEAQLEAAALQFESERYQRMLPFTAVINDKDKPFFTLITPAAAADSAVLKWTIKLEDGTEIGDEVPISEFEISDYTEFQGQEYDFRRFWLPQGGLPHGYYTFSAEFKDGDQSRTLGPMPLIITPAECYVPDFIKEGHKCWGVSVQLYALRSEHNWGIGDFADLKELLKDLSRRGGSFVGLNPLHAGYPANPDPDMVSPYSPSSRQWLNIIYIRPEDIPEFNNCRAVRELIGSHAFKNKLRALRDREYVDYRQVLELKLKALRTLFDHSRLDDRRSIRGRKFLEFVEEGGRSLLNMATYDALQASLFAQGHNAWGWQEFPKEYRHADSAFVEMWRQEHAHEVQFYCYLQFIAAEQLEAAFAAAKQEHMLIGTYRDLAVGVAPGSCDVWGDNSNLYRADASIGAPPDVLGPLGQSWGLAPIDPFALQRSGYRQFIELYRSNMRSCGALRIDHAAGLSRLWWVPRGHHACDGAYVANPLHDLMGILALESQRSRCLIIAEDLGTIEWKLRVALKDACCYSYKIFFGERAGDGGYIAPQDYAVQAMSVLTTHDMPTIRGWWGLYDLKLGVKLGIYTPQQADALAKDRNEAKQRILDSLHGLHSAGSDVPRTAAEIPEMTPALQQALQIHMCRGSSLLFSSQLEDWIGIEKPVNVPGTFREYPNWRRKLTKNLSEIFSDPAVSQLTQGMTAARNAR